MNASGEHDMMTIAAYTQMKNAPRVEILAPEDGGRLWICNAAWLDNYGRWQKARGFGLTGREAYQNAVRQAIGND